MPKRVEDIIPNGRRSVREIPLGAREPSFAKALPSKERKGPADIIASPSKPIAEKEAKKKEANGQEIRIKRVSEPRIVPPAKIPSVRNKPAPYEAPASGHARRYTGRRRGLRASLVIGAIMIVGLLAYFASAYFARAVFTIKARQIPITVKEDSLIALPASLGGSLSYEVATVTGTASTTVEAVIGSYMESKAQGTVTFYNSYSQTAWRLIAGTRMENSAGLVYRLAGSVIIPGFTKSKSGEMIPGASTGTVIADQSGSQYNAAKNNPPDVLHVVSYTDNPKYDAIYALVASPIAGGFAGNKVTVAPAVVSSTTALLQAKILANGLAQLSDSVPLGYILYGSAHADSFGAPQVVNDGASQAVIAVQGTVYGILFKKADLVSRFAHDNGLDASIAQFKGFQYDTPGLEQLSFNISNLKDFSPDKKNPLVIKATGSMKLVGIVPVAELKNKFAGKTLADTEEIIKSYSPVIDLGSSSGQVVPPWAKIPTNESKIEIIVQ